MSTEASPILDARAVCCAREGHNALCETSLAFAAGSFTALTGERGCGKNLLLRVLGLLERPDAGDVLIDGEPTRELADGAREELRNTRFGYLFAAPFLLPALTVIENVAMPLFRISRVETPQARERSEELLEFVGLAAAAQQRTESLSHAAQQRVSLARSLANAPAVLLVEDLDAQLGGEELQQFSALLRAAAARFRAAVISTASPEFAPERDDRLIEMAAGRVRRDSQVMGEIGA